MKRSMLLLISAITIVALAPATVQGAQTTGTFLLVMEAPNFGVAPNGDEIEFCIVGPQAPSSHHNTPGRRGHPQRPGHHQLQPHPSRGEHLHQDELGFPPDSSAGICQ